MTDADRRLAVLFTHDLPPARDPAFEAEVLGALIRKRFLEDLGLLSAASVVGGVAFLLLWPSLSPILASLGQSLAPAAAALAMAASILVLTAGRAGRAGV